jgi:hypothetical protein
VPVFAFLGGSLMSTVFTIPLVLPCPVWPVGGKLNGSPFGRVRRRWTSGVILRNVRRIMANWVMVLALMSVAFPSNGVGQTKDDARIRSGP